MKERLFGKANFLLEIYLNKRLIGNTPAVETFRSSSINGVLVQIRLPFIIAIFLLRVKCTVS